MTKKSKGLTYTVLVVVTLSLLLGGFAGCGAPAEPTPAAPAPAPAPAPVEKLIIKNINMEAITVFNNVHNWDWWAKKVNQDLERAGYADQYEVVTYPAEQLAKGADMFEAIRDNIAECGLLVIPYEAGLLPLAAVSGLPFLYKDHLISLKLLERYLKAGLQDYYHSFGVHLVAPMSTQGYGIWTKEKPVRKLEDVKGLKIRTTGGMNGEILKALGATPVFMVSPEVYGAMAAGTVDGLSMMEPTNVSMGIHEVTKYVWRGYFNGVNSNGGIAFNLGVWKSLPKPVQVIMELDGRLAHIHHWEAFLYTVNAEITEMLLAQGTEINYPTPEEEQRWKDATMFLWDDWLEKNGDEFNGLGRRLWEIAKAGLEHPHMEETFFE